MASNGDNVAFCVLTNQSLLTSIAAFSSGISYSIYQVKQKLVCASDAYNEDAKAPQDMELWQNAIIFGGMQTLEALRVLSQTPKLGSRLEKLMYGLSGFALTHTQDLALLDWLHASFPSKIYNNPYSYEEDKLLGAQGHVKIIQWMLCHNYCISGYIVYGAASTGQLELIQYLHDTHEEPFGCVIGHIKVAAANGHLDVVRFLLENRRACLTYHYQHKHPTPMDLAATNGHLDIVQYLHESRWDGVVFTRHTSVVQFLHIHHLEGCSSQAMVDAVKNAQLQTLQLLCEYRGTASSVKHALQLAVKLGLVDFAKLLCDANPT